MNRKYGYSLLFISFFLVISGLSFITLVTAAPAPYSDITEPLRIGDSIRNADFDLNVNDNPYENGEVDNGEVDNGDVNYEVIDMKLWLTLDAYYGYYFFDVYELWDVGVGDISEVWIQQDRSWPDPDPQGRVYPEITPYQVSYLLSEFETNIYEKTTEYFGVPDFHDGSYSALEAWGYFDDGYYYSEEGKNVILVSNVRDDNYYTDFPYYIAGFYSPSYEFYFDRNIINIDAYDWANRIGSDVARPFLYESVIAHEYQHLIHDDYNPDDDLFMNEGCSMIAEFLCGYGVSWTDINYFLATPDNSLTEWGDQGDINILADYGVALLWTMYLHDQFGGAEFISYFVQEGIPGILGIENALRHFGYDLTFNEVFRNWRIANLIHSDYPGGGIYNYHSIDLANAIPVRTYEIKKNFFTGYKGSDFGPTVTYADYVLEDVSLVGSYGSDYIKFKNYASTPFTFFKFDGDDTVEIPRWVYEDGVWYSTPGGSLYNLPLYYLVDPALYLDNILTFDTYFDIEDYWDFGFVQYSTDDGETWTSLANEYTTVLHESEAWPEAVANLPGITGWSGDWITMSFELPDETEPYLLCFRLMTDWAFEYEGWYIANVNIGGEFLDDNAFFTPPDANVDFMVTFIRATEWRRKTYYSLICDLCMDEVTNEGMKWMFPYGVGRSDMYVIISPLLGPADYEYSIVRSHPRFLR